MYWGLAIVPSDVAARPQEREDMMNRIRCQGCGREEAIDYPHRHHYWNRHDAYGVYTGMYCDRCYESNYPYRKDRYYDEGYAGERLEED